MTTTEMIDREQLLDQAMFVFWQHGYQASSISMLLAATRLSRTQFYRVFGDKPQLFRAVMARYQAYMHDVVIDLLDRPQDPAEAIRQVFELTVFAVPRERRVFGCLFVNTLTELSVLQPDVVQDARQRRHRVEQAFIRACGRAAAQQQLQVGLDAEQAGLLLMTMLTGLRVQSRSGVTEYNLRQNIEPLLHLLFVQPPVTEQAVPA